MRYIDLRSLILTIKKHYAVEKLQTPQIDPLKFGIKYYKIAFEGTKFRKIKGICCG